MYTCHGYGGYLGPPSSLGPAPNKKKTPHRASLGLESDRGWRMAPRDLLLSPWIRSRGLVCNRPGPLVLTGNLLDLIKKVDQFWAEIYEVL